MGIMDMFSGMMNSGAAAPAAPAGQPTPPGNIPATAAANSPATPSTAANGAVPPGTDTSANSPASPLDQFADLWKNDATTEGKATAGVFGDIDPKKFMEAAQKIDFSKAVTPEQLQAISGGGEGAVKAFAEAMNTVSQNVYAQSSYASTKMIEAALAKSKDSFMAELPTHIKKQSVSDTLRQENPIFSNPAVQPIISALESQLTVKFPNASASEITGMAKQYVEALGTSFTPKPAEDAKAGKGETDWSTFLL